MLRRVALLALILFANWSSAQEETPISGGPRTVELRRAENNERISDGGGKSAASGPSTYSGGPGGGQVGGQQQLSGGTGGGGGTKSSGGRQQPLSGGPRKAPTKSGEPSVDGQQPLSGGPPKSQQSYQGGPNPTTTPQNIGMGGPDGTGPTTTVKAATTVKQVVTTARAGATTATAGSAATTGRFGPTRSHAPVCTNIVPKLLGHRVTMSKYAANHYNEKNGGPVVLDGQLDCDADTPCCWNNAAPPYDKLEFSVAEGRVEPEMAKTTFGTYQVPDGKFLLVASPCGEEAEHEAQFQSCTISCTHEPVKVTLMYWSTNKVEVMVCARQAFYSDPESNPLLHCVTLPKEKTPGPYVAELPPGEAFDVVIVAKNFASVYGDLLVIDNIRVDYLLCSDKAPAPKTTEATATEESSIPTEQPTTTEETTEPTTTGLDVSLFCEEIECDFESLEKPPCNYKNDTSELRALYALRTIIIEKVKWNFFSSKQDIDNVHVWRVMSGRFKNYVTGIHRASDGSERHYTAVYLKDSQKAVMSSTLTQPLPRTFAIRFLYYTATMGNVVSGCCDTVDNCPLTHDDAPLPGFRKWRRGTIECPAGTKKIIAVCENMGLKSQGACGFDNVVLYDVDETQSEDSEERYTPLCGGGGDNGGDTPDDNGGDDPEDTPDDNGGDTPDDNGGDDPEDTPDDNGGDTPGDNGGDNPEDYPEPDDNGGDNPEDYPEPDDNGGDNGAEEDEE